MPPHTALHASPTAVSVSLQNVLEGNDFQQRFPEKYSRSCVALGGCLIKWSPEVERESHSFLHRAQKVGRQQTRNHKALPSRRIMFFLRAGLNDSPWESHLQ